MQRVFVLSADKKSLDPCHPARARQLQRDGKSTVFRVKPFTIILKNRMAAESVTHEHRLKLDPGSKCTGIAILQGDKVVWAAELQHRSWAIKKSLDQRRAVRRSRRSRNCRYRPPRFDNRRKPQGWLPPSLQSRVENVRTWALRLSRYCPLAAVSVELAKFDIQKMANAEISGVEYQHGELFGFEVKEYLLEKFGHKCVYCGGSDVPLEVEHLTPKSRNGSDRVGNLALACVDCNQKKGNKTAAEFGYPELQQKAQQPLRDAAALNATRWAVWRMLVGFGLPVEVGTGGRTKWNRTRLGLEKQHWLDAACVGASTPVNLEANGIQPLLIQAKGHGSRQMCMMNRYGFPRTSAKGKGLVYGFRTGDLVRAVVPNGKQSGTHIGRVVVRARGSFGIDKADGISWRYCQLLQRADGYNYLF